MNDQHIIDISKSLSNPVRLQILNWLREPAAHFPPHETVKHFDDGVCVSYIREKTGLSQSTISTYLTMMEKCGLLVSTRHGKWSYFKRNETVIQRYIGYFK